MSFMAVNNLAAFVGDARTTALRLLAEADAILARSDRGAAFHNAANQKAVEISDFLGASGDALDETGFQVDYDLHTTLGERVDQLVSKGTETLGTVMRSPTEAFTGSLRKDAEAALEMAPSVIVVALVGLVALAIALK